jgi:hypothetical protein
VAAAWEAAQALWRVGQATTDGTAANVATGSGAFRIFVAFADIRRFLRCLVAADGFRCLTASASGASTPPRGWPIVIVRFAERDEGQTHFFTAMACYYGESNPFSSARERFHGTCTAPVRATVSSTRYSIPRHCCAECVPSRPAVDLVRAVVQSIVLWHGV